jgi:hypothetical protein
MKRGEPIAGIAASMRRGTVTIRRVARYIGADD